MLLDYKDIHIVMKNDFKFTHSPIYLFINLIGIFVHLIIDNLD